VHPATLLAPALLATLLFAPATAAALAEEAACGDPATPVHRIQGSGPAFDPAYGGSQTVEGVVTASMLGGVFVQEEAGDADADPATSEGIFVFLSGRAAPSVGSLVRVTGTVAEFGGAAPKTELTALTELQDCGPADETVQPVEVSFPLAAPGDLEHYEGMQVRLVDDLVISEYFDYDRFGEVVVADPPFGWDRLYTPTAVTDPGPKAQALAAEYARRRITIDDASTRQNPATLPHPGNGEPFGLDNRFRGGDTITGIEGVVDQAFGAYRLQPTEYGRFTARNRRPAAAPRVGGGVRVASLNVLNYFLTLDDGTDFCGPQRTMECRGADNSTELQRQRAKILAALERLDADVVGLMEMENTPGVEPAADLAAGLNARLGEGTYDFVDTGVVGTDAIRLGFLYQPHSVRPVGTTDVLDSSDDARFDDTRNRPMLTQTFDRVRTGARFTVSVNHLKSKGSACDGDPDTGDGQGNCNVTRTQAVHAITDHLAADPTGSGDPDHLVIGDLNSYDHEDPVRAFADAGYADQVRRFGGEPAYGYVFDGQAGYLDHALADATLAGQVTGAREWHVNADEPDVLDYDTSFKPAPVDAIFAPDPYRSSDHDAVLAGLDLDRVRPQACYADGSQRVASYQPGRRSNGAAVPRRQRDPEQALGVADGRRVTLGRGGALTMELARPAQNNNGASGDLRVVDVDDGAHGRTDSVRVLASRDGKTWQYVGAVSGTGRVDLGELASARFVRLLDTTADSTLPSTDGYDLDAVEVLTGCA
jgi:uncharacterized protein